MCKTLFGTMHLDFLIAGYTISRSADEYLFLKPGDFIPLGVYKRPLGFTGNDVPSLLG